jgi:TonB-linked SusC/RagA family outer membrane protein
MNKKYLFFIIILCLCSATGINAQSIVVEGTVTDASNMPLPGATVVEKGTQNGTSTDFDGNYSIEVPANATLVFSMIGSASKEVPVNNQTNIDAVLDESTESLDEVIVTALGIKRQEKSLGYSLSQVDGDELSTVKVVNPINSLQGKVAGVNVTGSATGPSGTSNVVIRGASSLSGTNQPLYVIDGIPIDNSNLGSATNYGGVDFGDGISSINPDDIATMSILKGGAAAALYGSRASGGVILITTKSGKGQQGLGVELSSSVQFDNLNSGIYEFQREYGQGTLGVRPGSKAEALSAGLSSWGGSLDGSLVPQFDGVERPYSYSGDNVDKFYRTGTNLINTVAVSKAGEGYNIRFSATNLENEDIIPNAGLNRKSFSLNAGVQLAEKLTLDVSGKYILENVQNRPRLSDSPGNTNVSVVLTPPNVDVLDYKPGLNAEGTENRISTASTYHQNPYFSAYNFSNESLKNRFIGSATLRYNVTDWMYLLGRAGIDQYVARQTSVEPFGTAYKPLGGMTEVAYNVSTVDADFMVGFDKTFAEKYGIDIVLGANNNDIKNERTELNGQEFVLPGLEDISNVTNRNYTYDYGQVKRGSLYFSAEFSYDDYFFVTATGRQDWFSTLSLADKSSSNSYFYPSVSGSFVFSDAFDLPEWVTFGKLRAGYSDIGGGAEDPYVLSLSYGIFDNYTGTGNSVPLGRINNSQLPNKELKPFSKKEYEFGLNARFFNSRLGLDLTYYSNKTTDDIVPISISNSSGYDAAFLNVGELTNKGVEMLLDGSPIRNENFDWNVSYNLTYNKNEVVKTDADGNPFFSSGGGATGGEFAIWSNRRPSTGGNLRYHICKR